MVEVKNIDMLLGEQQGCKCDDIIYVPLSPQQVENLYHDFKSKAEDSKSFSQLDTYVDEARYYRSVFCEWEERREKLNEEDNRRKNLGV